MAQAALKICPGCRRKYTREKLCEACAAVPRHREKKVDPFYVSREWRRLRAAHLEEFPLCVTCEAAGRTTAATMVDHRIERRDDPSLELEPTNLDSMCLSCHNRKTALARGRRRRGG